MSKLIKKAACVAALAASSFAQAGVVNFEGGFDTPLLFHGGYVESGGHWFETYAVGGSQAGDLAGVIVDGSDNGLCIAGGCPVNNPTNYYTGLNDGYLYFGQTNNATFRLSSLQASWVGAERTTFPSTAGAIQIQGYNALGQVLGNAATIFLPGPSSGAFNFATYDLDSLSAHEFSFVRIIGFGCNSAGDCFSGAGVSNFAIDNITIPEPTSMALFGLGLIGLGAISRRRRAV